MIRLSIIILVFVLSASFINKEADTNYYDKPIRKTLNKFAKIEEINYSIISLNDSIQSKINGKFFLLKNKNEKHIKYIYEGRVNTCRTGGCSNNESKPISINQTSEYFNYIILFDSNKTISYINIYDYRATHGYEISTKWWLKQFREADYKTEFKVGKNVDAISGATVSVYAITNDLNNILDVIEGI